MIACIFDTETTGLIDNQTVKLAVLPQVIEFACIRVEWETMEEVSEYSTLVKPLGKITNPERHRITDDMVADAPSFSVVAGEIAIQLISDMVVAHNLSFDMEMIDVEFKRLGRSAAWPLIRVCTVEQTVFLFGRRMSLSELYKNLTGNDHREAHRALADVRCTLACLREMRRREWL